jgi:hypothetical protein
MIRVTLEVAPAIRDTRFEAEILAPVGDSATTTYPPGARWRVKRPPALPEVRTSATGFPEIEACPGVAWKTTAVADTGTGFGCEPPGETGPPTRTINPDNCAEAGDLTAIRPAPLHPAKAMLNAEATQSNRTRVVGFEIISVDLPTLLPTSRLCPLSRGRWARACSPRDHAKSVGSGTLRGRSS